MARVVAVLAGFDHLPGATVNRFCASSRADHPDGLPRDQGRRGRHLHLRPASSASPATSTSPAPAGPRPTGRTRCSPTPRPAAPRTAARATTPGPTRARTACCPTSTWRWARPPRTSPRLRGISRERQDEWGVTQPEPRREGHRRRLLRPRDHARSPRRTAPSSAPTTARAPASPWRRVSGLQPGVPRAGHGHRRQLLPAQRRRRRARGDERHQGPRARPHPARPGRVHRRQRACRRRSWASARSRPPARRWPAPA